MPEIPVHFLPKDRGPKDADDYIRWRTVSYRALALWVFLALALATGIVLALAPSWRHELMAWLSGADRAGTVAVDTSGNRQARFTNVDGGVRVRRAQEVEWATADLSMELDKGDLVQTDGNGVARIAFADGTLYVVGPTL